MDAEFFISRAEREVDRINNRVILTARDKVHADGLRRCCIEVAQWANGKETIIRWTGGKDLSYRIPAFLAHYTKPSQLSVAHKSNSSSPQCQEAHSHSHIQIVSTSANPKLALPVEPKSKDDELIIWAQLNKKPTGICSLTTGQVLFMNSLMPEFCGLAYDQIAVPDISTQFEKRGERQPDDLTVFNERLIKDKEINGSMKAFRTSGAFGYFHGCYRFGFLNGIPIRISEDDSFELVD